MNARNFGRIGVSASILAIVGVGAFGYPALPERFPEFVQKGGCELIRTDGSIILKGPVTDQAKILTVQQYQPPFVVRTRAKTDSTNIRLYYSLGVVILNWEGRQEQKELRLHDPATGEQTGVVGQGYLEPDKYYDIAWELYPDGMRVLVDGKERGRKTGNYENLKASVGIGPAWRSVVTIQSFRVEPLKGKLPEK
jgi:hypothetical protein